MERNISEQELIVIVIKASMNKIEKKLSSLENESNTQQKTNMELFENYGDQKTVVGKNVWTSVNTVSTRFVGIAMCISGAIQK